MDNARFIAILNAALRDTGLDVTAPASPSDPGAVAAWAAFLRRCVGSGVSLADPRWRDLELRARHGTPELHLASVADPAADDETDFTLGLSLLMSLLNRDPDES
jgi:hypothetical protein